jgi:dihydroorotase
MTSFPCSQQWRRWAFEFRLTYLEVLKLRPAKYDLVLNLHGEVADISGHGDLSHEEAFLPTLMSLHQRFPNLRIVLEHCTTAAALAAVRACGPSVAGTFCFRLTATPLTNEGFVGTITAHHLYLTSEDCCDPLAFCKPIPKKPTDRDALAGAVCSGDPKFFL